MHGTIRRLTFVTDAPHFGGAERYITTMARMAGARGVRPHVYWLACLSAEANVFDELRAEGVSVTVADGAGDFCARVRAFAQMIAHEAPDALVINASGRRGFWQMVWLARYHAVPCLWVHHMVDGRDYRCLRPRRLGGRVEGLGLWRVPQMVRQWLAGSAATAVVTLNPEDRQHVIRRQRVAPHKVHVIPNGIDARRFRFAPDMRRRMRETWAFPDGPVRVVGTAARLVTGKGVERLIEAVAVLRDRGLLVVLVVAGTGPDRGQMADLARRLNVAERVRFLGFVEDMPALYSGLDVFALCSATESFGLVLAEAMACERPVVATPTAGAMRQIRHGHNGWLLNGFASRELADALETMFCEGGSSETMGHVGRQTVLRQFGIDLALERTLHLLQRPGRRRFVDGWPHASVPALPSPIVEDRG